MNTPSTGPRLPEAPREYSALIGGELIPAKDREGLLRASPAHGVSVSRYPKATAQDVTRAIESARAAADAGTWASMSGAERARILNRVAQLIDKHREELGLIESLEVGKPITAVAREIQGSVGLWEFAATLARHAYGDLHDKLGPGSLGLVFRQPIGVVGMITPWNYPLLIVSQKLPFALATGNCAVIKPSELTSGTALRLGELLIEAGVPAGVVNIVVGDGPSVGEAICRSPLVDMISFTGSTGVGRRIGAMAGEAVKRVSLELGGKSAQIVCADADLELAAERVATGFTRNAGQACVSGSRLLVERSIARDFTQAVAERIQRLKIGDPLDPTTEMGPLVSQAQFDRVCGFIEAGQQDGAQLHQATQAIPLGGYFMQPGIFTGVRPSMSVAQEEIFGPMLSVMEFDTTAEAIQIANGTAYGLAGSVWTRDINKAFSIATALKTGTVEVNTYMAGAPELPLSGHKQSGVGHEKGRYSVEEFTHLKTIQLQITDAA